MSEPLHSQLLQHMYRTLRIIGFTHNYNNSLNYCSYNYYNYHYPTTTTLPQLQQDTEDH